jgi:small-conductance mechanosensitive channel
MMASATLALGALSSALLATLVAVYLMAVLLKRAAKLRGELSQLCLVTAVVIVPALATSWVVYDGDPFGALGSADVNTDPSNWWVLTLKHQQEGLDPVTVNLLGAALILGLLAIGASMVVEAVSALYFRKRAKGWLSIHKALVKWPIVVIGGLILLKIDVSTILLGTSVAVIGIGFVLKETLENLFTGVALELEGSVRKDDWISVGDDTGQVIEKTWRATKLYTLNHEAITVPNRLLGSDRIKNYTRPGDSHAQLLYVGASYDDPPVKVKEILRAILIKDPGVLRDPFPLVRTIEYGDFSINYDMKFWIRDYGEMTATMDRIMTHVWYAFRFYGVTIPFPIRTVHLKERAQLAGEEAATEQVQAAKEAFLRDLPYFEPLARKDIGFLAQNAFGKVYGPSDHVLHKGDIGDALYVVQEGSCLAMLPDGAREIPVGRYFGEMGLLKTGPRTVDVLAGSDGAKVLRIDKHCMQVLFRARPDLRKELTQVGEERKKELPKVEFEVTEQQAPLLTRLTRGATDLLRPW